MTTPEQTKIAGAELTLQNLKGPSNARDGQLPLEDQLARANAEIAKLRKICFGDTTIADRRSHELSFTESGNVEIKILNGNLVPMDDYLKDLISQGLKIDIQVWTWHPALNRHSDPKFRPSENYKGLTEDNIQPLMALLQNEARDRDVKHRPYIKISYHQQS